MSLKHSPAIKASAGTLPTTGFIRLTAILGTDETPGVYPVSKTSWYRGIKEGRYPESVSLGPRAVGWRVEDIRALIERGGQPDAATS